MIVLRSAGVGWKDHLKLVLYIDRNNQIDKEKKQSACGFRRLEIRLEELSETRS